MGFHAKAEHGQMPIGQPATTGMLPTLQGSYHPITQKQADSAHIHERLAPHKTPMMLTAANVSLAAPFGSTPLGCSKTTWGLGNTALTKCVATQTSSTAVSDNFAVSVPPTRCVNVAFWCLLEVEV